MIGITDKIGFRDNAATLSCGVASKGVFVQIIQNEVRVYVPKVEVYLLLLLGRQKILKLTQMLLSVILLL